MSHKFMLKILFFMFFLTQCFSKNIYVDNLDFDLVKKGSTDSNNTLLLIGGIQGDEPGGFNAANIIINEYEILKGAVWVVPNLNSSSILANSRGLSGDMNRKFMRIDEKDPDYKNVMKIQQLILDENVSLVLNLHDGSGFYRQKYINKFENPTRWGNSAIIDQVDLNGSVYGNLYENADFVTKSVNKHILDEKHKFHIKNTKTKKYDKEMQKSLTYFSIRNDKAAYANEASKDLKVEDRVFYHLLAIEKYMDIMGIEFKRDFELSPKNIYQILKKEINLSLFDDKFYLSLKNPREVINCVPMPKNAKFKINSADKLVGFVQTDKNFYKIYYGNRHLTTIKPQYFEFSDMINEVNLSIDGNDTKISLNTKIKAKSIKFNKIEGVRINVIGYESDKFDESDVLITKKDLNKKFSIDKNGKIYRVEFYEISQNSSKNDKFIGMILVEFDEENIIKKDFLIQKNDTIFRFDNKFFMHINNLRENLNFVPMQKDGVNFTSNNENLTFKKENFAYIIYDKNRAITTINPQFFEYSDLIDKVDLIADDKKISVNLGTKIKINKNFMIKVQDNVRVNVIGYDKNLKNEAKIIINKNDFMKRFSVDKNGKIYRVEFYEISQNSSKNDKFIGMILIEFEK